MHHWYSSQVSINGLTINLFVIWLLSIKHASHLLKYHTREDFAAIYAEKGSVCLIWIMSNNEILTTNNRSFCENQSFRTYFHRSGQKFKKDRPHTITSKLRWTWNICVLIDHLSSTKSPSHTRQLSQRTCLRFQKYSRGKTLISGSKQSNLC
jgi:hypothetical protein